MVGVNLYPTVIRIFWFWKIVACYNILETYHQTRDSINKWLPQNYKAYLQKTEDSSCSEKQQQTKKQTYVIKSINTSSTIYAKSAHIETSVNMMTYYQSLLEIYLRLYTYKYIINIYIYNIYKQPANRNIYFCNKKSTNFWNDRTIRFRRTKAVSFIFQVMCIQQKDV